MPGYSRSRETCAAKCEIKREKEIFKERVGKKGGLEKAKMTITLAIK